MKIFMKIEDYLEKCQYWSASHRMAMSLWNFRHRNLNPGLINNRKKVKEIIEDINLDITQGKVNQLPLYVFDQITQLSKADKLSLVNNDPYALTNLQDKIRNTRIELTRHRGRSYKPSVFLAINQMVEKLLSPTANANNIAGLGSQIFDNRWKRCQTDKKLKSKINKVISVQTVENTTVIKIQAIADLSEYIYGEEGKPLLPWWPQIEFVLVNQLLMWPLFVGPHSNIGYPFALDIKLNGRSKVTVKNTDYVSFDRQEFKKSLEKALNAAKMLWRSQNGNASITLRKSVKTANLIIDAGSISAILQHLGTCSATIGGRSLEAYIAIAILGRLSGIDRFPAVAISGVIGNRVNPEGVETLDFEVNSVEGIPLKYKWAVSSRMFNTVILPEGVLNDKTNLGSIRLTQRDADNAFVETNFVSTLNTAANVAFGTRWRRYRSVRAPDFLRAMLKFDIKLNYYDNQLEKAKIFLKGNQDQIAQVPSNVSTEALMTALINLNKSARSSNGKRLPKRSILFFRLDHNEPRARMLISLFSEMGVEPALLHKALNATGDDEVAKILALALNSKEDLYRRAPDIIVFIKPSGEKIATRSPVAFDEGLEFKQLFALFGKLADLLKPTCNRGWVSHIGRTRILILNNDDLGKLLFNEKTLKKGEISAFAPLSIMRHGFTPSMVRDLLGNQINGDSIHEWLEEAQTSKKIYFSGGHYFLSANTKRSIERAGVDIATKAQWHKTAALACAPYLTIPRQNDNKVRVLNKEALNPEFVHEAQYHIAALNELEAAMYQEYSKKRARRIWRQTMGDFQNLRHIYASQLGCFYDKENWDLLRYAIANPRFHEAYLGYVTQTAFALVEESNISKLPLIRLTAILGIFDEHLQYLERKEPPEVVQNLRNDSHFKKIIYKLSRQCRDEIYKIEKRAIKKQSPLDVYQATFATGHLMKLTLRKGGLPFDLGEPWLLKSHDSVVSKMSKKIENRLLENENLPSEEQDDQLGYCPPPEWFARYVGSFDQNKNETASKLYKIGRQHRRHRIQRSAQLFVNAIGIVHEGSTEENEIFDELRFIFTENEYKFAQLLKHVVSIREQEESIHWKQGYERYVNWARNMLNGTDINLNDITPEDGDDMKDSDFNVGAWVA